LIPSLPMTRCRFIKISCLANWNFRPFLTRMLNRWSDIFWNTICPRDTGTWKTVWNYNLRCGGY
jgi:hypothetical protein